MLTRERSASSVWDNDKTCRADDGIIRAHLSAPWSTGDEPRIILISASRHALLRGCRAVGVLVVSRSAAVAKQILPWFGVARRCGRPPYAVFRAFVAQLCLCRCGAAQAQDQATAAASYRACARGIADLAYPWPRSWKPAGGEANRARILLLLAVTIRIAVRVAVDHQPIDQSYFAPVPDGTHYRLFALSNTASLVALVAYPVVISIRRSPCGLGLVEPVRIFVFAAGALALAGKSRSSDRHCSDHRHCRGHRPRPATMIRRHFGPVALDCAFGGGSMLLLAVSNHRRTCSVPLLWIPADALSADLHFDLRRDRLVQSDRTPDRLWCWSLACAFLLVNKGFSVRSHRADQRVLRWTLRRVHGVSWRAGDGETCARHLTAFICWCRLVALGALVVSVVAPLLFAAYVETALACWFTALLFVPVAQAASLFCNGSRWHWPSAWLGTTGWYVGRSTERSWVTQLLRGAEGEVLGSDNISCVWYTGRCCMVSSTRTVAPPEPTTDYHAHLGFWAGRQPAA